MKHKRKKLMPAILLVLGLTDIQAQQSVNSTGGVALGNGGSASYSIGQMAYTTNTGSNGFIAQGVQQPYEVLAITDIEETMGINLSIIVYPNPTTNYLILYIEEFDVTGLSYYLYDMNGKLLLTEQIKDNLLSIDVGSLLPANYFLKIVQQNKNIKTLKITKN